MTCLCKKTSSTPNSLVRRAKIRSRQRLYRSKNNSPYLSGDSFASLADLRLESENDFGLLLSTASIDKRVIFIKGDLLQRFLRLEVNFPNRVVVISGNSDENFTSALEIPTWVSHIFCQNYAGPINSRISTIPIGIENLRLGRNGLPKLFQESQSAQKKVDKILIPPMAPTNEIRKVVKNRALQFPDVFDVCTEYLLESKYFKLVRSYQFIFCCEGNGFDSHRIWETLYLGSFPVVLRTPWSSKFEHLGMPILFVDDLSEASQQLLRDFHDSKQGFNPRNLNVLWIPYWEEKIGKY